MNNRLDIGSPAPEFSLPDATGAEVSLADFAGRRVVVYFYPAAMTPGCTIQAVDFTAAQQEFRDAGYEIVGISPDSVDKLATFRDKEALGVTLLADPDRQALNAYGAWGTKMLYGKEITGVLRSTFVVDVDEAGSGTIALAQYNVKATGHVDKLKRDLGI
ncbi:MULTISPECIES: thioredoxin-dependent thiol peroxidase [Aestuariimicrobium]|uniref:thioredoxin-dependent thiol peroxidase n=1 Tax=Aestuariimicrobium TaxID=396388 RepID=UPI0003B7706D|nr:MULTISPECIES: thioredoxin-dependent thiol peroxidase [Aestuariimicrobium]CAI9407632.1 Putative peroxiredoxin [Aestuariimicrobium sp. T2.26MG-19.2B]